MRGITIDKVLENPGAYNVVCEVPLPGRDENGNGYTCAMRQVLSVPDAIASQRFNAHMCGKTHLTDGQLLVDYRTVHYAWFEEAHDSSLG